MTNPAVEFWRRFLAAFFTGDSFGRGSPDPGVIESILEAGEHSHLLEFIDVHRSRQGRDRHENWNDRLLRRSREARTRTTHRNRIFRELIEEIDASADSASPRYSWLKGAVALKEGIYPTGSRRLSDLDLLVRKDDLADLHKILVDLGYRAHRDPEWITGEHFSSSVASTFYTRRHRGMKVLIDLHWHLVDYPARRYCRYWDFSLEPIWERAVGRTMAPEHRLIYLLDHAFTHNFTYWKFLVDVRYLLREKSLDWSYVRSELKRTNLSFLGSLVTSFLERFFRGVTRPNVVEELLEALPANRPITRFETRLLDRSLNLKSDDSDYLLACLGLLPDCRSRVSFLRYILLPPVEAVPMVRSDSGWVDSLRLYVQRLRRVMGKGFKLVVD